MPDSNPALLERQVTSDLTDIFRKVCSLLHAQVFTEGADRHGSLVWEAAWNEQGRRYLTLAVTPLPRAGWQIEVWAAASDGQAYSRRLTSSRDVPDDFQMRPGSLLEQELEKALLDAGRITLSIQPGEPDQLVLSKPAPVTQQRAGLTKRPGHVTTAIGSYQVGRMAARAVTSRASTQRQFTPREQVVLRQLAQGASRAEIATVLGLSHATVARRVINIMRKIETANLNDARKLANGYIVKPKRSVRRAE